MILSTFRVSRYRLPGSFLGEAFASANDPIFVTHRRSGILDSCNSPLDLAVAFCESSVRRESAIVLQWPWLPKQGARFGAISGPGLRPESDIKFDRHCAWFAVCYFI